MTSGRAKREIEHGERLAEGDPELRWGWGSPAGRIRAERRAQLIASGACLRPGARVLEVGCGTGLFTEMFARSGAQIIAVDISDTLLRRARAKQLPQEQVKFIAGRFEDCRVEGPFDAVIGSSVLHHLDMTKALPMIFDLLKENGSMCFAEPNMLNPQIMLQKNIPALKRAMGDSPDETAFTRWQLRRLARSAGFENVQVVPFDWLHPAIPRSLIAGVIGVGRLLEKMPGLREIAGSLLVCARRLAP